jgi:hypothetical protein
MDMPYNQHPEWVDRLLDGDRLVGGLPHRLVTFRGWAVYAGRDVAILQADDGAWFVEDADDLADSRPTEMTQIDLDRR